MDKDEDGLVDMHNDVNFIQTTRFAVTFNAAESTVPAGGPIGNFRWTFRDQNLALVDVVDRANRSRSEHTVTDSISKFTLNTFSTDVAYNALREKAFYVTLDIRNSAGSTVSSQTQFVRVKDILIVSIGDSMSAGEGNPEREADERREAHATWADTWDDRRGKPPGDEANEGQRAHRSSNSYPARLALQLEKGDPHSSVTFVSVASSGAQITEGLLSGQISRADHTENKADPQLEKVDSLVGQRRIDAMTITIGVNDVHFADIAVALAFPFSANVTRDGGEGTGVSIDTFAKIQQFAKNGLNPAGDAIAEDGDLGGEGGLDNLPAEYALLNEKIESLFPRGQISRIFISQYPDPLLDANGQIAPFLTDIVPGVTEIDIVEATWARNEFFIPLNAHVLEAARDFNWELVTGIPERFGVPGEFGHGLAAESERWILTPTDAFAVQSDGDKHVTNDILATLATGAVIFADGVINAIAPAFDLAIAGAALLFGRPDVALAFAAPIGLIKAAAIVPILDDIFTYFRDALGRRDGNAAFHPNRDGHIAIQEQNFQAFQNVGNPTYYSDKFTVIVPKVGERLIRGHGDKDDTNAVSASVVLRENLNSFTEVVVDGFVLDAWPTGSVTELRIVCDDGEGDVASVSVQDVPVSLAVTIDAARNVTVGRNNSVSSVRGSLTINGGTLLILNSADTANRPDVVITSTSLTGLTTTQIVYNNLDALSVSTGSGNDIITVNRPGSDPLTINGGSGNDTINVNVSGLISLASPLTIDGGAGTDSLNISGNFLSGPFELRSNRLNAQGLVLNYGTLENLVLTLTDLLGRPDTVDVFSTHTGSTVLNTGGGVDIVRVHAVSGQTTINTGSGNDIITVNRMATGVPVTINGGTDNDIINVSIVGSITTTISSPLTINGNAGTDSLNISGLSNFLSGPFELRSNRLNARGLELNYGTLENLVLTLSGGADTVDVFSTHTGGTVLNTSDGNDSVRVHAVSGQTTINTGIGSDIVQVGSLAPANVNFVRAQLNINGGPSTGQIDTLTVDDTGDTIDTPGTVSFVKNIAANLTPGSGVITGLGMTNGGINFLAFERVIVRAPSSTITVSSELPTDIFTINARGLAFHGTDGDDRIRVSWQDTLGGPQAVYRINRKTFVVNYRGGSTISVFGGKGNDEIIMEASAGMRWRAQLFGGEGNDHLVGSLNNDRLDGGLGNDHLEGGVGDDVLIDTDGMNVLNGGPGSDQIFSFDIVAARLFADQDDRVFARD